MAVRSGAGTGVIVSLVVFVLTTVFLLVLTIVFYAGKTDALEAAALAKDDLNKYATAAERSGDLFKQFDQARGRRSVAGYLNDRYVQLANELGATNPQAAPDQIILGLGVSGETVNSALEELRREVRSRQVEIDGLNDKLAQRDAELSARQEEIERLKAAHQRELEEVRQEIITYRDASERYGQDVADTLAQFEAARRQMQQEHRETVADLEDELDAVNQDLVIVKQRLKEYQRIINEIRVRSKSPDLLVDGDVIDVEPASDLVYINRGRRDRIVLGMRFEIYDSVASIGINPNTSQLPRGKATVEVTKVGETTSTCTVLRSVPGRPVVRGNVIANAIYDPKYKFKFLVHGRFDVDRDGRPTAAEAEHLRSKVVEWGGEIVLGDSLPGDLDFLVLGEEPPQPPPLPPGAAEAVIDDWVRRKEAVDQYERLRDQAADAQIPILNANRFFILTGLGGR
jgi:hypothetical protein